MAIDFAAGQVPTADKLLALAPAVVRQGVEQSVTSSTSLADTQIVLPIDGLCEVRLAVRWTSLGGGMRWDWNPTSGVSTLGRNILSPGVNASHTSGSSSITEMRHRQIATFSEDQTVEHFSAATTFIVQEWVLCEGEGEITFRFAQQTSDANATTIHENSYGIVTPLREL